VEIKRRGGGVPTERRQWILSRIRGRIKRVRERDIDIIHNDKSLEWLRCAIPIQRIEINLIQSGVFDSIRYRTGRTKLVRGSKNRDLDIPSIGKIPDPVPDRRVGNVDIIIANEPYSSVGRTIRIGERGSIGQILFGQD
jgi:hypothetical protein